MRNSGKHPIIANGQYYIEPLIKRNGVKSKFVCKFIFQLCGFIYATFIFKRFD